MKDVTARYLREVSIHNSPSMELLDKILSHCYESAIKAESSTAYYIDMDDYTSYINDKVIELLIERGFITSIYEDYQERCYVLSISWY